MGFAAGFQVGAQAVERGLKLRDEELMRQEIERIQKETPENVSGGYDTKQYTPEQIAALEANPETGGYINPMPAGTKFLGQTYTGGLTPERMNTLRQQAMADIVSRYQDPVRGLQMRQEATRAEREAQEFPLRLQGLKQQVEQGGYSVSAARRAEQYAQGNLAANEALAAIRAEGKPVDAATLASLAKTHGADYQALLGNELNQLGFTEKSIALESKQLGKDLSRAALGGIPGMNKFLADKFDPNKADNITPEIVQTKGGFVVMYGDKALTEYGTHKSLNELVSNVHGMIAGDPLGTAKTLASIRASNASAALHEAEAGLVPAKAGLLQSQRDYYANVKGSTPTMLVNAKGEPVPVVLGDLQRENGMYKLPEGLRFPKDVQQANALESRAFETLTKSDAWQAAERKGDIAEMNKLMVNRGIDPAKHGMGGGADWQIATRPSAARPSPVVPSAGPLVVNDEDYRNVPGRSLSKGYGTPDARGLLRTPAYSSGMRAFNPED